MAACVIRHNIIVEEERDDNVYDEGWEFHDEVVAPKPEPPAYFADFLTTHSEIQDRASLSKLQEDLVYHMWSHVGNH
jgi:hypothetical protein